jgi:hypothetical protein
MRKRSHIWSATEGRAVLVLSFLALLLSMRSGLAEEPIWDRWQWRSPLPQGERIERVVAGNGLLLGVTVHGCVLSDDGIHWRNAELTPKLSFSDATFGGGQFVALGSFIDPEASPRILPGTTTHSFRSRDGTHWEAMPFTNNTHISAMAYGVGHFVGVGLSLDGTPAVLSSVDGLTWNNQLIHGVPLMSGTYLPFTAVTYGAGTFVAVGGFSKQGRTAVVSTNGTDWVAYAIGGDEYRTIAYGNGLFVAVGRHRIVFDDEDRYIGGLAVSKDGISWNVFPSDGSLPQSKALTFGNGMFVGIAQGSGEIISSSNGTNWSQHPTGFPLLNPDTITFVDGVFVAAGAHGNLLTSTNGLTWSALSQASDNNLRGVIYANNKFVAVGNIGAILTSSDGRSWTGHPTGTGINFHEVCWGKGTFVAVGDGAILLSTNGADWQDERAGDPIDTLDGVVFGNNQFVAVGSDIFTSPDGLTWKAHHVPLPLASYPISNLHGVTYGAGTFAAVGLAGALARSSDDGSTWQVQQLNMHAYYKGVCYGAGLFVAVGASAWQVGTILSSPDAVTWTTRTNIPGLQSLDEVLFANGSFIAAGEFGEIVTSEDGVSWRRAATPSQVHLRGITYGQGSFVVVGNNETVLQSPDLTQGLLSLKREQNSVDLTISGEINRRYLLQSSPTISDWSDLRSFVLNRSAMNVVENLNAGEKARFFRLLSP